MKSDILKKRKCIHIAIDKDVHASLRTKLFNHGMSMQEVFGEFAKLVASDDYAAGKIVERLILKRTSEMIGEGSKKKKPKKKREYGVSELDADMLYDLIEEKSEPHEAA